MRSVDAGSPGSGSNPFATRFVRPGALAYRFTADDQHGLSSPRLNQLVSQLQRHSIAQIVGPHGSGKTTLIQSLAKVLCNRFPDQFPDVVHLQLHAPSAGGPLSRIPHAIRTSSTVHQQQRRLCSGGLLIVDGAEQLGRMDRLRIGLMARRRQQTLLATSHRPLWGMEVLHKTVVSRDIVYSLTDTLLSKSPSQARQEIESELSRQDWTKLTNVRDLWFDFYDVLQRQRSDQPSLDKLRPWPSDSPSY